jgi:hypothetical protein
VTDIETMLRIGTDVLVFEPGCVGDEQAVSDRQAARAMTSRTIISAVILMYVLRIIHENLEVIKARLTLMNATFRASVLTGVS